jgi:hypothetical protein
MQSWVGASSSRPPGRRAVAAWTQGYRYRITLSSAPTAGVCYPTLSIPLKTRHNSAVACSKKPLGRKALHYRQPSSLNRLTWGRMAEISHLGETKMPPVSVLTWFAHHPHSCPTRPLPDLFRCRRSSIDVIGRCACCHVCQLLARHFEPQGARCRVRAQRGEFRLSDCREPGHDTNSGRFGS